MLVCRQHTYGEKGKKYRRGDDRLGGLKSICKIIKTAGRVPGGFGFLLLIVFIRLGFCLTCFARFGFLTGFVFYRFCCGFCLCFVGFSVEGSFDVDADEVGEVVEAHREVSVAAETCVDYGCFCDFLIFKGEQTL